MLKVFRDNLKYLSWILWLVVGLFIFFVFADFGGGFGQGQGGPMVNAAAEVGDETVTMDEFENQYRQLENMYRQIYGEQFTPEIARQMQLPMQALNQAVNEKILLEEARRLGLVATDEEVRDRILQEDVFKDEQGRFIGEDKYAQLLQANRYTVASFEEQIREEVLIRKLESALEAGVFVSEPEVEKAYREQVERATIRYIQVPRSRFPAADLPQSELAAYFQTHQQEFRLPEQREAAYLVVDGAQLAKQIQMDDKTLREYYDSHKDEFARQEQVRARHILIMVNDQTTDEQARQRIEAARARLQKGEPFGKVAGEVSEDPSSKVRNGDLGYFARGAMVKEFEDAAFNAQKGQVIGPVKTTYGYHLIEVLDKLPGGQQPFEAVREAIRGRLASERTQEMAEAKARELAGKLRDKKPAKPEDVQALANANPGVTYGVTPAFGRQDAVPGLGFAPAFTTAAFSLKKGEVSEPIQIPRGWAVLWVKEVREPRVPQLAEVEPRVRAAVVAQKQQEQAIQQLRTLRGSGKNLDQIAAEMGLEIKESSEFGATGSIPGIGVNPELAKAALALRPGQVGGPVRDSQGALLFEVKDRKTWDPIQFAAAREETRGNLRREKLNQLRAAMIEKRRRELDIEFNPQVLESFGITAPATQES